MTKSTNVDFTTGRWRNQPQNALVTADRVEITTEPGTDFWQRSYYGFRNDNAPALQITTGDNFTFTVRAAFHYRQRFDQCGLIVYLDADNWFKAGIEYENAAFSRLGSVVTNFGYSDWATTDIATPAAMWYRLSRRGPDFLIESAAAGRDFRQMRIFHLHCLGATTTAAAQADPPPPPEGSIEFGLYACSPLDSSFTARFTDFQLAACRWPAHAA